MVSGNGYFPHTPRLYHETRRTALFQHKADGAAHHGLRQWPICPKTGFASPGCGATTARNFLPLPAAPSFLARQQSSVPPSSALLRPLRGAPPVVSGLTMAIEAVVVAARYKPGDRTMIIGSFKKVGEG